jgi:hypothetical protein
VARGLGFARLFANRETQEVARALATCWNSRTAGWQLRTSNFHFETNFDDGTFLVTANSTHPTFVPPRPDAQSFRFPGFDDPARLHRIHSQLVDRFAGLRRKEFVLESRFRGDVIKYQRWVTSRAWDHFLQSGYYYRDERTGQLRLTTKGAIFGVLRMTFPLRQLRARHRERTAARLLREFDRTERR